MTTEQPLSITALEIPLAKMYNAVVELTGPSGATWRVRTGWIVLYGESVARFVTAFPD